MTILLNLLEPLTFLSLVITAGCFAGNIIIDKWIDNCEYNISNLHKCEIEAISIYEIKKYKLCNKILCVIGVISGVYLLLQLAD